MKKVWKILFVLLWVLILGMLILDIARVAWCKKPFLRIKTSCEYEANHSVYKELWLWYEYVENSADDGIGGIITKVFWHSMCDVPAWNLTSCKIDDNPEDEKYVINSKGPVIVENIQILEEWDLWWFDTKWQWIPVWFWWAAFYYLPYDIENFDEYYSLIKWNPKDKYHIRKITINGDYTSWLPALAILKVEKPTKSEEEKKRIRLDQNFISEELIFEQNRYFSAFWNNPKWTLTAEPRDIDWSDKRYDVRFYEWDNFKNWVLMHLFKAWDNYRFLYDKLDIKFIKWECNDWIQWEHKKAESNYKVIYDFWWEKTYEWCWNTRTEDEIIDDEPEVISPEDEQRIQYLENLVSWDINNNETTQQQDDYEGYNNEENDILVVEEENMNTDYVINLKIWDKIFDLSLEKNSATKALIERLEEWDVIVNAREYWWFEKVGNLGFDLPREDKQITTEPGDLVLYQWNQISLFYESNSWSYTKLWKVGMISKDGLKEILWDWDVQLVFSLLD